MQVLQDVVVERLSQRELTVLAKNGSVAGEELAVQLRSDDGRMAILSVTTLTSSQIVIDGRLRYRLSLRVLGATEESLSMSGAS